MSTVTTLIYQSGMHRILAEVCHPPTCRLEQSQWNYEVRFIYKFNGLSTANRAKQQVRHCKEWCFTYRSSVSSMVHVQQRTIFLPCVHLHILHIWVWALKRSSKLSVLQPSEPCKRKFIRQCAAFFVKCLMRPADDSLNQKRYKRRLPVHLVLCYMYPPTFHSKRPTSTFVEICATAKILSHKPDDGTMSCTKLPYRYCIQSLLP